MNHTFALLRSLLFNVLSVVVMIALCLVISLGVGLSGAESATTESRVVSPTPAAASTTNAKTATVTPVTPTLDLRDALAISVRERSELREQVAQLQTQKWLMIGCVIVITGVAIWLGMMILNRGLHPAPQVETKPGKNERESDVFPADTQTREITSVTKRKNATITIRNGATQKEEVTGNVETRRFFTKDDDSNSKRTARGATATVVRKTSRIEAPPIAQESELRPSTDRTEKKESPMEPTKSVTATQSRPKTVRVDHHSDRLDPVDVALKPGTGPIYRQSGFSILEVMISLAILATVLASVISTVYTLHYSRMLAKQRATANEIARMFIERIMAAPAGDLASGTFLAPRFESFDGIGGMRQPLTQQDIKSALRDFDGIGTFLLSSTNQDGINAALGLNGLKIFVEYYRIENLIYAMQNDKPLDLDDNGKNLAGVEYKSIGLNENLDDRVGWNDGVMAIRVVVKWKRFLDREKDEDGNDTKDEKVSHVFARGL